MISLRMYLSPDHQKRLILSVVTFLILSLGLLAGYQLTRRSQDIRQQAAAGEITSLTFSPSTLQLTPGQTASVSLNFTTNGLPVTASEIHLVPL